MVDENFDDEINCGKTGVWSDSDKAEEAVTTKGEHFVQKKKKRGETEPADGTTQAGGLPVFQSQVLTRFDTFLGKLESIDGSLKLIVAKGSDAPSSSAAAPQVDSDGDGSDHETEGGSQD